MKELYKMSEEEYLYYENQDKEAEGIKRALELEKQYKEKGGN